MYNVLMLAEMFVQDELDIDLFGGQTALPKSVVFVDELDCNNGLRSIVWNSFADRCVCALADCLTDKPEG